MKPTVYLLCGLPGSGKSTYAKEQEARGLVRLILDEELFKRFGREFPSEMYSEYEAKTKAELKYVLQENIAGSKSVILDYGFWKKAEREEYKQLIETLGAQWRLLYFKIPTTILKERLQVRNHTDLVNNHQIDDSLLDTFSSEFEAPVGEGAEIIEQY
ncbi:MAG: ATP-binding protein [Candidatus Kaiserbacteria bacterium]|nr:ATP-binding protein [Candidatus Kaiserbacteria bacterium]